LNAAHLTGARSEALAAAYFLGRGWNVYEPMVQQGPADLVVLMPQGLRKVQVKTATWAYTGGNEYLRVRITRQNGRGSRPYTDGEFDFLVVLDDTGTSMWSIPWEELPNSTTITLAKRGESSFVSRDYNPDRWRIA
jgi:hypothetical protein